jgi:glucokinase
VENQRAIGQVNRISIERLCAGPAVPLIYDFMRDKHKDLEKTLEKENDFKDLTSKMIINSGVKNKDPLCLKVVDKFTEIFGVEVGNAALKTLPFGGIYLTGGVTAGIQDYMTTTDTFLNAFYMKGRQEDKMRLMPVYIIKPDV